jgi:hypothetical protein
MNLDVQSLRSRLPEIDDYFKRKRLRAEPHKYPKNLFRAQSSKERFEISAYLSEIDGKLQELLEKKYSSLEKQFCLQRIAQQINVLINTAKSHKQKARQTSLLEELVQESKHSGKTGLELLRARKEAAAHSNNLELVRCENQLQRLKKQLHQQMNLEKNATDPKVVANSKSLIEGLNQAISDVEEEKSRQS